MMILYVSRRSRARCQRTRSREQKKSLTLPKHCLSFSSSLPLVSSLYFSFCVLSCALHVTHHRDKISITVSKNSHSHTTGVINDQPPTIVLYPHTIVLHSTCLHTIVLYLYHRLAQNLHANRLVPTCHAGNTKQKRAPRTLCLVNEVSNSGRRTAMLSKLRSRPWPSPSPAASPSHSPAARGGLSA